MSELPEWKKQIMAKAKIVMRVAATPEGQALFGVLEKTFQSSSLLEDNPQRTAYNLGQYELVQYLKDLRDIEDTDDAA